ncbi:MAG: PEGA domain-containing protein [Deltaproteobacteria bacterium]|nr:PEGA domain-containing protein [Deltaproteobacteria bacterium]
MRWRSLSCGIIAALTVARGAEARSIAVVPIASDGPIDAEEVFLVGEAIAAALRERGHDVLGPVETAERIEARSPGCIAAATVECWSEAATRIAREVVVSARLRRDASAAAVSLELVAWDSANRRAVAEVTRRGPVGSPSDLVALARTAASGLNDALPDRPRHARLRVESSPSGANVQVDGVLVGRTPWSDEVPQGPRVVRLELEGHRPVTREVTLATGQTQALLVDLEPTILLDPPERIPHSLDLLDAVLGAVAVAGVAGGAAILVASVAPGDEACAGGLVDDEGDCQYRERAGNLWPAAGMIAAGVISGLIVFARIFVGDPNLAAAEGWRGPSVAQGGRTIGLAGAF